MLSSRKLKRSSSRTWILNEWQLFFGSSGTCFLENSWYIFPIPTSFLASQRGPTERTPKKTLVWSTNSSNFVRGLLGFAPIQNGWWNFLQKHHATPKHVEHVRHGRFSVGQLIRSPRDVKSQPRGNDNHVVRKLWAIPLGGVRVKMHLSTYCWPLQTSLGTSRSKHLSLRFGSISAYWSLF